METFVGILVGIAAAVILLLLIAAFGKKDYAIHREIIIHRPAQQVFEYYRNFRNHDYFNKWILADPTLKKTYSGTDGQVGSMYAWEGNKNSGKGEQEIKHIEGTRVDTEVRFFKPFTGLAQVTLNAVPKGESESIVSWSMTSRIAFPMNLMRSMMIKMLTKDLDTNLQNLKNVMEK